MVKLKKFEDFIKVNESEEDCECDKVSEELKFALQQGLFEAFRYGSQKFFEAVNEARENMDELYLSDEDREVLNTDIGRFGKYENNEVPLDFPMVLEEQALNEAEYKGKKVKLNYPKRGGSKKYYVYVKSDKGNVIKLQFGDTTGLTAKVSDPEARKSFAARHKCKEKKDKTKAGYWACRINRYGHLWGGKTYPGYW